MEGFFHEVILKAFALFLLTASFQINALSSNVRNKSSCKAERTIFRFSLQNDLTPSRSLAEMLYHLFSTHFRGAYRTCKSLIGTSHSTLIPASPTKGRRLCTTARWKYFRDVFKTSCGGDTWWTNCTLLIPPQTHTTPSSLPHQRLPVAGSDIHSWPP